MKILYIIAAAVVIMVAGGFLLKPADSTGELIDEVAQEEAVTSALVGALRDYTGPTDLEGLAGTNILFFKASWCITCTTLYNALVEDEANIPAGLTIWVVDYDSNKDMRIKYGVTTQHTLVQVDTDLNKISLWRGSFTLAEVLSNIK